MLRQHHSKNNRIPSKLTDGLWLRFIPGPGPEGVELFRCLLPGPGDAVEIQCTQIPFEVAFDRMDFIMVLVERRMEGDGILIVIKGALLILEECVEAFPYACIGPQE